MTRAGGLARGAGLACACALLFAGCAPDSVDPVPEHGTLERDDGATIAWWAVGDGPPMLIVHGGPGLSHRYLRPGLDTLGAAHRLVYYDQRGTGESRAPLDTVSISLGRFVGDLDALRAQIGAERVLVLGHSFGTLVALAYARAHPERVRGLVLMNPVEPGARFREETARLVSEARAPEDAAALRQLMTEEAFRERTPEAMERLYRILYRGVVPDPAVLDDVDVTLDSATARNGPEIGPLLGPSMGGLDWWDELPDLRVPTLILHARAEPTPVAMSEALAAALPEARLEILESGHFPYVEVPGALFHAVTAFTAALPE